ncbi:MAG: hypothetical protein OWQ48_00425 [Desulfurococcus sp.]|nr:hypothetical protein [Desulfurococcus sp.]
MENPVRKELEKFFERVISEDQGSHILFIASIASRKYILCLPKTRGEHVYGKLVRADAASSFDCKEIEYEPRGLYIFAKSIQELAAKVHSKLEQVDSQVEAASR